MRLQTQDSEDYHCAREAVSPFASSHEIEVYVLQEVLHEFRSEAQLLRILTLAVVLEQQTGDEHCRQERRDNTDHVSYSEALDRTGTEDCQDSTGKERSHVRIYDGRDSTLETILDSFTHPLSGLQLLADTLINKHVTIDRTTHRQDNTGDTRKGQYCAEGCQNTQQQEDVAYQCKVGDKTRNPAVIEDHVNQNQAEAQYE